MQATLSFDHKRVNSTRMTEAGRYATVNKYQVDPKEEYSFSHLQSLNPDHTEDVSVRKATHLVYDGGALCIPHAGNEEFNAKRSIDMSMRQYNSITTQRSLFYRLFVDVDPKFIVGMSRPERITFLADLGRIYQEVLREMFPDVSTAELPSTFALIATSERDEPKVTEATEETEAYMKQGTHFYFADIIISSHQARLIREMVLARIMERGFGMGLLVNDWDDVIDEGVYTKAGLRPVFAPKFTKCKNAKKSALCYCGNCDPAANGYYEKGPHRLLFCLSGTGAQDKPREARLEASTLDLISATEIRTDATEVCPRFVLPSGAPRYAINPPAARKISGAAKPIKSKFREDANALSRMRGKRDYLEPTDPRLDVLLDIIREYKASYGRIMIRDAFITPKGDLYLIRVKGEGESSCGNLRAPKTQHNSNTVYFCVRPTGVSQKCFCSCNTTERRITGMCKNYESIVKGLSAKQLLVLFPDSQTQLLKVGAAKTASIADMQKRLLKTGRSKAPVVGLTATLKTLERMAHQIKTLRSAVDSSAARTMTVEERAEFYHRK